MVGIRRSVSRSTKEHVLLMSRSPIAEVRRVAVIAKTFGLCRQEVYNIIRLAEEEGRLHRPHYGRKRILSIFDVLYLESLVEWKPDLYLSELQNLLLKNRHLDVHISTIQRTLRVRGFTRKKVTRVPLERNEDDRAMYQMHMSANYTAEQLVFVDEAGANRNTMMRAYAWAPADGRARRREYFIRGQKYSILPAISLSGVLYMTVIPRSFKSVDFNAFIDGLLDNMNPFPGPNSVVVMDNASIHKSEVLRPMIEQRGMRLEYLPPYSPDFDPIEEGFSAMKAWLRRNQDYARLELGVGPGCSPYALFWQAVHESMTPDNIKGWYYHSNYL